MKTVGYRLKNKLNEVFLVSPNDLGWKKLTDIYKWLTQYLKQLPFLIIVPLSFLLAIVAYLVLGKLLVRLVTILQYGF